MKFELVIDSGCGIAETPIWDDRSQTLLWNDLFTGDVYEFNPATKEQKMWKTNALIGSCIPCDDPNKIFVMIETGAYLLDKTTGELEFLVDPENGNEKNRYNDTRIDAKGRIFTSSVAKTYGTDDYTPDQLGAFYMIDTDHKTVKLVKDGINQYNCIVWNKDNTKMFVVDTYNETLLCWNYDLETGPVGEPEIVINFKGAQGMPDGVSIDEEDNLYVCHWSQQISVWNKDFELVKTIDFPVPQIACGGFGGADLKDFYVASAAYQYTEEDKKNNPGAGGTFVAKNDIKGRMDYFFK